MSSRLWLPPSFVQGFARCKSESEFPELWDGLVGLWQPSLGHQGITTLRDFSGYNNHGTLNGSMTNDDWVVGPRGYALDFDGSNDSVSTSIPNGITYNGPVSVVTLLKANALSLNGVWIAWDGASKGPSLFFNSTMRFGHAGGSTANTPIAQSTGVWYHFVGTYDGTNARIYQDGKLNGGPTADTPTGTALTMSRIADYASFEWNGQIAYVMVYARTLQPSEIRALYQGASPLVKRVKRPLYFDTGGNTVHTLEVTISADGTISGQLTRVQSFQAQIDALGEITGTLTRVQNLATTEDGVGAISGDATIVRNLAGQLDGVGEINGSLRGVFNFSVTIDATGTVVGSLQTSNDSEVALSTTFGAVGNITAQLFRMPDRFQGVLESSPTQRTLLWNLLANWDATDGVVFDRDWPGTVASGSYLLDTNGNIIFDPEGQFVKTP